MNMLRPVEARYARSFRGVAKAFAREYESKLLPRVSDIARTDADESIETVIASVGIEVHTAIRRTVGPLFDRMASDTMKANKRAADLFGIKQTDIPGIQEDIKAARERNIQLVENAHRVYAQSVREVMTSPDAFGMRVETLKARLLERGNVSESRAELIARDQTLKLNGQITQARQTRAGVEKYVWSTSNDDRVRESHAALEGQTFSWTMPPEPGHPGQDFQCRCVAIPSVDELDDIFGGGEPSAAEAPEPVVQVVPEPEPPPVEVATATPFSAEPEALPEAPLEFSSKLTDKQLTEGSGAYAQSGSAKVAKKVFKDKLPTPESWKRVYKVPEGFSVALDKFTGAYGDSLGVTASIKDAKGETVGEMIRTFSREKGALVVNHDIVKLDESQQGKGVGEALTRSAIESYRQMGVDRIELDAAWVGRYTWAKFGFTWPEQDAELYAGKLERYLTEKGILDADAAKKVALRTAEEGAPAVARLEIGGQKVGKDFLLDDKYIDGWSGHLKLDDKDPHFQGAKERLGIK